MKTTTLTTLAAAIGFAFSAGAFAGTTMSKSDYKDAKKAIESEYQSRMSAERPATNDW